jgi:hypothetical protein
VLLTRVHHERDRRAECEGRVLADIKEGPGIGHLDSVVLHGVQRLQARNDFTGGKLLDLKATFGQIRHILAKLFGSSVSDVERLREA